MSPATLACDPLYVTPAYAGSVGVGRPLTVPVRPDCADDVRQLRRGVGATRNRARGVALCQVRVALCRRDRQSRVPVTSDGTGPGTEDHAAAGETCAERRNRRRRGVGVDPAVYALYGLAGNRQAESATRSGLLTSDCTVAFAMRTLPSLVIAGAIRREPVRRTPGM